MNKYDMDLKDYAKKGIIDHHYLYLAETEPTDDGCNQDEQVLEIDKQTDSIEDEA